MCGKSSLLTLSWLFTAVRKTLWTWSILAVCYLDNCKVSNSSHSLQTKGQSQTHYETIYENSSAKTARGAVWNEEEHGCLFCCAACFSFFFTFKGRKRKQSELRKKQAMEKWEQETVKEADCDRTGRKEADAEKTHIPGRLHNQLHGENKRRQV